jgi:hypothetical protein
LRKSPQKGASIRVGRSFWECGIPARWQLKLLAHFAGEAITIVDWAKGETSFPGKTTDLSEAVPEKVSYAWP